jgi:hypothetical protein
VGSGGEGRKSSGKNIKLPEHPPRLLVCCSGRLHNL